MSRYSFTWGDKEGIIEVDQSVIDHVDDEWRSALYPLHTEEEIVAHIAWNMVANNLPLHRIDGWADMNGGLAHIVEWPLTPSVENVARIPS